MILLFLSFFALLDDWIMYYLPFLPTIFSYLQPQFFITTILAFFLLRNQNKKKMIYVFIIILVYDLLFSRIYFFRLVTLLLIYKVILCFQKQFELHFLSYIVFMILSFFCYFFFQYLVLFGIGILEHSILYFMSIFVHFLSFHVVYSIILYFILGIKRKKA